jgi:holo-[acyl-carrier protein] synthase
VDVVSVGIDLVDVARIERMLARRGERVTARLLTDAERDYVAAKRAPARHIAVRVAAKEAAYKALQAVPGARAVSWQDLEVVRDGEGRPGLRLRGLAQQLAGQHGPFRVELSLTHSDATAAAVVLLIREST